MSFEDNSTTEFINNRADYRGGPIFAVRSHISFEDSSTTTFSNNNALGDNNAILTRTFGYIIFNDNSACCLFIISNKETIGGIVYPISTLAIMQK